MVQNLTSEELKNLIQTVFAVRKTDKRLAILIDVPDDQVPDNEGWRNRRKIARSWEEMLNNVKASLGLEQVSLIYYPNVHNNNADLPEKGYTYDGLPDTINAVTLREKGRGLSFQQILSEHQIILAPTEFSATAPLKLSAKKYGFRAATMPGFSNKMIPTLKLDFDKVNQRIQVLKKELDAAIGADLQFTLKGAGVKDNKRHAIYFDLRFRTAHASGGLLSEPGAAGNLPGGECYIVPYEGERGEPSRSQGTLPVQFEDEIVLYKIKNNRAVAVISSGKFSSRESRMLQQEPAYGNIAELGFGVLKDFGIAPIGKILIDEKLGLHIAFGRSDHFGGAVGVKDFTNPENVIHIDRIYIPETQDQVQVDYVKLTFEDGSSKLLMKDGKYAIDFSS